MTTLLQACALAVSFALAAPVWADKPDEKAKVKIEFRRAETKSAEGLTEAIDPSSREKIYLYKKPDATNEDIAELRATEDNFKMPAIEIVFTKEGAKKIAKLSEEHLDKPVAILVNGKVMNAPIIKSKFSDRAQITGRFTKEEVEKLVKDFAGK